MADGGPSVLVTRLIQPLGQPADGPPGPFRFEEHFGANTWRHGACLLTESLDSTDQYVLRRTLHRLRCHAQSPDRRPLPFDVFSAFRALGLQQGRITFGECPYSGPQLSESLVKKMTENVAMGNPAEPGMPPPLLPDSGGIVDAEVLEPAASDSAVSCAYSLRVFRQQQQQQSLARAKLYSQAQQLAGMQSMQQAQLLELLSALASQQLQQVVFLQQLATQRGRRMQEMEKARDEANRQLTALQALPVEAPVSSSMLVESNPAVCEPTPDTLASPYDVKPEPELEGEEEEEESDSDLEAQRERTMQRNRALLAQLGLGGKTDELGRRVSASKMLLGPATVPTVQYLQKPSTPAPVPPPPPPGSPKRTEPPPSTPISSQVANSSSLVAPSATTTVSAERSAFENYRRLSCLEDKQSHEALSFDELRELNLLQLSMRLQQLEYESACLERSNACQAALASLLQPSSLPAPEAERQLLRLHNMHSRTQQRYAAGLQLYFKQLALLQQQEQLAAEGRQLQKESRQRQYVANLIRDALAFHAEEPETSTEIHLLHQAQLHLTEQEGQHGDMLAELEYKQIQLCVQLQATQLYHRNMVSRAVSELPDIAPLLHAADACALPPPLPLHNGTLLSRPAEHLLAPSVPPHRAMPASAKELWLPPAKRMRMRCSLRNLLESQLLRTGDCLTVMNSTAVVLANGLLQFSAGGHTRTTNNVNAWLEHIGNRCKKGWVVVKVDGTKDTLADLRGRYLAGAY